MPVAKALDTMLSCQVCLGRPDFGNTEVVKAQVCGNRRLTMSAEHGARFGHVGPFSKPLTPPSIVFRNRVVLREIKRHCSSSASARCAPLRFYLKWHRFFLSPTLL